MAAHNNLESKGTTGDFVRTILDFSNILLVKWPSAASYVHVQLSSVLCTAKISTVKITGIHCVRFSTVVSMHF